MISIEILDFTFVTAGFCHAACFLLPSIWLEKKSFKEMIHPGSLKSFQMALEGSCGIWITKRNKLVQENPNLLLSKFKTLTQAFDLMVPVKCESKHEELLLFFVSCLSLLPKLKATLSKIRTF